MNDDFHQRYRGENYLLRLEKVVENTLHSHHLHTEKEEKVHFPDNRKTAGLLLIMHLVAVVVLVVVVVAVERRNQRKDLLVGSVVEASYFLLLHHYHILQEPNFVHNSFVAVEVVLVVDMTTVLVELYTDSEVGNRAEVSVEESYYQKRMRCRDSHSEY